MSRRRGSKLQFHEPSLVPLADMLTNTVGIMVFILIFTVLSAGGATLVKRLPMERQTKLTKQEYYLCTNGRIYPLHDEPIDKLFESLGKPSRSEEGFRAFAQKADGQVAQDEFLRLVLSAQFQDEFNGYSIALSFTVDPKPDGGLTTNQVKRPDGFFQQDLKRLNASETALIFWVKPDGMTVFKAARDAAAASNFASNWKPQEPDKPIKFGVGGSGAGGSIITQ